MGQQSVSYLDLLPGLVPVEPAEGSAGAELRLIDGDLSLAEFLNRPVVTVLLEVSSVAVQKVLHVGDALADVAIGATILLRQ